jgi:dCMP deaminase
MMKVFRRMRDVDSTSTCSTTVFMRNYPHPVQVYMPVPFFIKTCDIMAENITKRESLDRKYLRIALIWAENSCTVRHQVGAILVNGGRIISDGYNGMPAGFDNACEGADGKTLPEVLHAESNCLMKLVRHAGTSSEGGTMYVTLSPCIDCAKLIIQAGIARVVYIERYHDTAGIALLKKAGVRVTHIAMEKLDDI